MSSIVSAHKWKRGQFMACKKRKPRVFQNPPLLPRNGMQNPARQLTAIMGQQCITSLSNAENALNLTAGGAIGMAGFRQMARI